MGAMPIISLSIKEKKLVTAPCGETANLRVEYSTHQLAVTVIATPMFLCKTSNERQDTWLRADVLQQKKGDKDKNERMDGRLFF